MREEEELEMVGVLNGTSLLLRRQTDTRRDSRRQTGQLLLSAAPGTNNRPD